MTRFKGRRFLWVAVSIEAEYVGEGAMRHDNDGDWRRRRWADTQGLRLSGARRIVRPGCATYCPSRPG